MATEDNNESLQRELTSSILKDRRSDRRWKNIRFICWMFILVLYAILIFSPTSEKSTDPKEPYAALVHLSGTISANTPFSAQRTIPLLQQAFQDKKAKGVVLLINSPGGSPVQASIIRDKIIELKKKFKKKVIVLGEDSLASGAYLVSTGADKIYVHADTLTGSIGVIMAGFGFVDTMKKVGATRRVFAAGDNKDRLDPFLPLQQTDKTKIKDLLDQVHQHFINDVLESRGDRLHGDKKELFSGDFWTGDKALTLGIVDGVGTLTTVLNKEFNVQTYQDYSERPSYLKKVFNNIGSQLFLMLKTDPVQAIAY